MNNKYLSHLLSLYIFLTLTGCTTFATKTQPRLSLSGWVTVKEAVNNNSQQYRLTMLAEHKPNSLFKLKSQLITLSSLPFKYSLTSPLSPPTHGMTWKRFWLKIEWRQLQQTQWRSQTFLLGSAETFKPSVEHLLNIEIARGRAYILNQKTENSHSSQP